VTYPDAKVAAFVGNHFFPTKVDVRNAGEAAKRFKVAWTPTVLVLDPTGEERHRFVGFLPPAEFLAHLTLGLGKSDFERGNFGPAADRFGDVVRTCPSCDAAAEAQYYLGVARYKQTQDKAGLVAAWKTLVERYGSSDWAKKARFALK